MRRHLGDSFKWLFYGDDDTAFLLGGAMHAVRYLDPDMPYFLTGDVGPFPWLLSYTAGSPSTVTRAPQASSSLLHMLAAL
jgi:hypothetical protein